jgi:hypothetical protein
MRPSASSAAPHVRTISLRVSAISGSFRDVAIGAVVDRDGAALDALLDVGADLHDAVHVDAGQMDAVGVEFAEGDELLDLRDADLPAMAASGLKLRAALWKTRLPWVSPPFAACTSAKSVTIASSST